MTSEDYRVMRLLIFRDPWKDPSGDGFQTIQSLFAIGPGGLLGKGLGNSIQKLAYLPMSQTDFIFAIIARRTGIYRRKPSHPSLHRLCDSGDSYRSSGPGFIWDVFGDWDCHYVFSADPLQPGSGDRHVTGHRSSASLYQLRRLLAAHVHVGRRNPPQYLPPPGRSNITSASRREIEPALPTPSLHPILSGSDDPEVGDFFEITGVKTITISLSKRGHPPVLPEPRWPVFSNKKSPLGL